MQLKLDPFSPNGVSVAEPGGATVVNATQLSTTGVTAGTYGNSTNVGQFTVDSTGRITAASNVGISGGGGGGSTSYATLAMLGLGAF